MSQEKKCYCPCTVSDLCTCQKCIVGFHMPSPIVEEKEGWEIKFDEKFTYVGTTSIFHEAKHRELKSFISQTLAEERERLVKEIEDYRIGWADTNEENNCCREIINIIKNNK